METVSDRIRRLRLEKGMTLEELGAVLGVGKATVQKYESGQIQNLIEYIADLSEIEKYKKR